MARNRIGKRRYNATFLEFNGNQTDTGFPDYTDPTNWVPVVANWPCELIGVGSGETVRGRQVTAETTHVIFGEWFGGEGVKSGHRCRVDGREMSVAGPPLDMDGMKLEMRIELKQESN